MSGAEIQVLIIAAIGVLGIILLAVLVALLWRRRPGDNGPKHRRRDMTVNGGAADLETGQIVADDNYFRGMNGENFETVLLGKALHGSCPSIMLRDSSGYSCSVSLNAPLTIGRVAGSGRFMVRDPAVSREHAVIFASGDRVYIQDNHSVNHTCLNGKILNRAAECKNGDIIRVGKTNIQITIR